MPMFCNVEKQYHSSILIRISAFMQVLISFYTFLCLPIHFPLSMLTPEQCQMHHIYHRLIYAFTLKEFFQVTKSYYKIKPIIMPYKVS